MNSCSAVPGVNERNEQWTADGTQRVSFHCSAPGQGGCANNQPVTHAADTQEHACRSHYNGLYCSIKNKEIPHFVTQNTRLAPLRMLLSRSGVDTLIHRYMRGGVTAFGLRVIHCISRESGGLL
jgi:hypothetical protein